MTGRNREVRVLLRRIPTAEQTEAKAVDSINDIPIANISSPSGSPVRKRIRTEVLEEPYKCPICLESSRLKKPVTTPCGHVYCQACISTTLDMLNYCPICRKKVSKKQLRRLYIDLTPSDDSNLS